jgi:hypothetical protein
MPTGNGRLLVRFKAKPCSCGLDVLLALKDGETAQKEKDLVKATPTSPEPPSIDRIEHIAPSVLYRDSWRYGWAEGYRARMREEPSPSPETLAQIDAGK